MSTNKSDLRLDWCSHEAAKYAVTHWHYTKSLPAGKSVKIGVWEFERFIGCVIFSLGANNNLAASFGFKNTEVCELTRVALNKHKCQTTRILAIAIKMLKKQSPGIKIIVSYADTRQGHHGGIYQGNGWLYFGLVKTTPDYFINGRWVHQRTINSTYGTSKGFTGQKRDGSPKHKYVYPLTPELVEKYKSNTKPYPKTTSCASSKDGVAANDQLAESGSSPTDALINQNE